jgi:signal transduction histidine kinase
VLKGEEMESASSPERFPLWGWDRLKQAAGKRSFWILAAMLASLSLLHYVTPQTRFLPVGPHSLARHAVERIIFILPIASASFAFGQAGGLVTLALSFLVMLPRVFLLSPYPTDAFVETVAVAVVGYLVVWMIEVQEREKRLRQEAVLRLKTINAITAIATGSLELEQIMDGALGKVLEVAKAKVGCLYLLHRETHELILAVCRGTSPESANEAAGFELGESLTEWVMQSGEPILVEDLWQEPQLTTKLASEAGLRSIMTVPLKSRDKVLGFMYLADSQHHRFTPQDLQLLASIGNQVGVAIENAQLHQDVARQLRIEQRLNEVAEEITSELELDRILPKVLQIAEELVGADGGAIALFDRERGLIGYPYLRNLPQELTDLTVPEGRGLAWEVMTTNCPAVIEDYRIYPRAIPAFVEAGVTSVVGVPIVSSDQSFGTLALVSLDETKSFSDRDVAILAGIGRQAGIAIENAHLYENMRFYVRQITRAQEDERKRVARELHDDTIQSLIVLSRRIEAVATSGGQLPEAAVQRMRKLQELTDDVMQSVRRFSQDLRPSILDDLGLVPALEGLTADLTQRDGVQAKLQVLGVKRRLLPEGELTLFRIAQEAFNNVKRHAQATNVLTTIEFTEGAVQMTIQDDGRGFRSPTHTADLAASGKLGLIGMYERARLLGGTLTVQSEPGQGTRVIVNIPT